MQFYLKSKKSEADIWYLNNGYLRHMTGNLSMFKQLQKYDGGHITFSDNALREIIGIGKIGKGLPTTIDDVYLVNGLKHNLLSIS